MKVDFLRLRVESRVPYLIWQLIMVREENPLSVKNGYCKEFLLRSKSIESKTSEVFNKLIEAFSALINSFLVCDFKNRETY